MDAYQRLDVLGAGAYGAVLRCRHRASRQIVAVKRFLAADDDATARKIALREMRTLKTLKHANLVTLLQAFRHQRHYCLVFEYVDRTVLDELEMMPEGLGDQLTLERIYQVLRAVAYCHGKNIVHRDIKPENVLVSHMGCVKLCDFGFARHIRPGCDTCTEYVATRWYRAPELVVGDLRYGPAVDVWAIGCLFAEMRDGTPLFPGASDVDQLHRIVMTMGSPCLRHRRLITTSHPKFLKSLQQRGDPRILAARTALWGENARNFLISCLRMAPWRRATARHLLRHPMIIDDDFVQNFSPILRQIISDEYVRQPLMHKWMEVCLNAADQDDLMTWRGKKRPIEIDNDMKRIETKSIPYKLPDIHVNIIILLFHIVDEYNLYI